MNTRKTRGIYVRTIFSPHHVLLVAFFAFVHWWQLDTLAELTQATNMPCTAQSAEVDEQSGLQFHCLKFWWLYISKDLGFRGSANTSAISCDTFQTRIEVPTWLWHTLMHKCMVGRNNFKKTSAAKFKRSELRLLQPGKEVLYTSPSTSTYMHIACDGKFPPLFFRFISQKFVVWHDWHRH